MMRMILKKQVFFSSVLSFHTHARTHWCVSAVARCPGLGPIRAQTRTRLSALCLFFPPLAILKGHPLYLFAISPLEIKQNSRRCTAGRMTSKSTHRVLGHLLLHSLARSLALLTHSIAPHCSNRLRAPLRSFVRSLAHSLTLELMGKRFLSMK